MSEPTIAPAAAAERLARELPHWHVADGQLQRTYRTKDFKGALMVAVTIGHLAEAAWHHPDLTLSYDKIGVALSTHSAGGITEKDFALAAKIESVIHWRPADGTPPSHAYILYN
jgi:pterin-4a-carbinolamine dehydratase